jgi:hypothetical protein
LDPAKSERFVSKFAKSGLNAKLKGKYYLRMRRLGRCLNLPCHALPGGVSQRPVGGRRP